MAWLADYQAFFSQVHGVAALAFWQQYPTPVEAVSADPVVMAELIHEASRGRISATQAAERAAKIQMCARFMVAAFGRDNPQRWSGWAKEIVCLAGHLAYLRQGLKELAAEMDELLEAIDSPLRSFSGLGTVTAATIHGETLGIERFATADHFARYNGTAPREDSSGRRPKHVKNRRCNTRLRRAMLQLALNAPRYHAESRDYLARLAARGIVRGAARLRLARRLSDIVYALLRDGKEYDHTAHAKKRPKAA
jgi:transposase